ncbi:Histone deacetylase complex subunit [Xanthoria parietina]
MSPRRSSRSKTSQPTSVAQHTSSSSSSVSSARTDRKSRADGKPPSPRDSLPPKSPSTDNHEPSAKPGARRTRSSQETPKIQLGAAQDVRDVDEEEGEEEEITRCVCGHQEYPGMPIASNDPARGRPRNTADLADAGSSVTLPEDTGGLFIQCDVCKVWQHGGCVGIMDEATSPEEYFCEQCRKELHTITITGTGQRYSNYLPVQDISSRQPSPSPPLQNDSPENPKESRSSRTNAERLAGKRRSTMNSRDAAYYEAEQLRQAIEESKKESTTGASSISRKGKRSRDEDDQGKDDNKRQRTKSGSSESSNDKGGPQDDGGAIEEANATFSPSAKNIRGAAARNHRKKELREQEEKREKDRADAAGRRKGRAEKRRGDESDPSEEPLSRNTSSKSADQIPVTATPPASQVTPSAQKGGAHHKRTGRPPARRGRVGRNQWTRDREPRPDTSKNPQAATSPSHSQYSKEGRNSPRVNGNPNNNNHHNGGNGDAAGKAPLKSRYTNPQRTSMIEMKRRVAAMLDFIHQADRELATEVTLVPSASSRKTPASNGRTPVRLGNEEHNHPDEGNAAAPKKKTGENGKAGPVVGADLDPERFRTLEVVEMKETMKKVMLDWQKEFG